MNTQQTFKQAIKTYYAEKSLSDTQMLELQAKPSLLEKNITGDKQEGDRRSSKVKWAGSFVASVLVFLFIFSYFQTPTVVSDAYADISKDTDLNNGMPVSMQQWLGENSISPIPQQYAVEMSKFCKLDQYLTTHLRIAGVEQGQLHLFFHQGEPPVFWFERRGELNTMNWRLLKIRDNLTLLVMFSEDMREAAVEQILDKILPGLQV